MVGEDYRSWGRREDEADCVEGRFLREIGKRASLAKSLIFSYALDRRQSLGLMEQKE